MMKRNLLLVALVLVQSACSIGGPSKPSRFYVLTAGAESPETVRGPGNAGLSVAVGPVSLPDALNRPQIVTHVESNRIELAEFDRWAGDLNQDLVRVLTQDLIAHLGTDNVAAYPWQGADRPMYQVAVTFFHFDGELGKRADLSGNWQVLDGRGGCQLAVHRFDITETPSGADYAAFVKALSEGLNRLSRDIAGAIVAARPGCP